ncbi:MAG: lipoate--protein ligase family protein [Anaerolineaceae bacterium]|nr:lipoate--protein ligase family protein [Anaerolineaceae bacterium]
MQPAEWRLIISGPAEGPYNMALDEAILECVGKQMSPPTLRLYAWDPPCLSLGFSQPIADIDQTVLKQNGWQLCRRPTGGRAILHTDELTYAVIGPVNDPLLRGGVLESYRRIATALQNTLLRLGLQAQADKEYNLPWETSPQAAVCFESPSNYEITVNGKKIFGSAQARKAHSVLQHGSLPLYGDLTRITSAVRYPDKISRKKAAERLLEHAATVEMFLNTKIAWQTAADIFIQAFQSSLNIKLLPDKLTKEELERAALLLEEKHANQKWLAKT